MRRTPVLAAAAAVLALAGCSKSTPQVNTAPASNPATTAANNPAKASAASATPKKARTGDTVDLTGSGGVHVQVTLVKVVDPAKPTNAYTPDSGKRFIAAQLRILNVGTKTYDTDPLVGMRAQDAAGETFDASIVPVETTVGQQMDSGLTLAPGDKALGVIVFEVPASVKLSTMQYLVDGFGGNTAQWTLG